MIVKNKASEARPFGNREFAIRSALVGKNWGKANDWGVAQLGRIDYSLIQPGFFLEMHPHQHDEILSYIRKGEMNHRDTKGNAVTINKHKLMLMNAGSGLEHEESVPDGDREVEMLQIFMRPRSAGLQPRVQFHNFEESDRNDQWRLIAGYEASSAPLVINSDIKVFDRHMTKNCTLEVSSGKTVVIYAFDGAVAIRNALQLYKGDSVVIDESVEINLLGPTADLIYFEVDENAPFSREGAYSG